MPDDLIDRLSSDFAMVTNESVNAVTAYMPRARNGNIVRASFNLEHYIFVVESRLLFIVDHNLHAFPVIGTECLILRSRLSVRHANGRRLVFAVASGKVMNAVEGFITIAGIVVGFSRANRSMETEVLAFPTRVQLDLATNAREATRANAVLNVAVVSDIEKMPHVVFHYLVLFQERIVLKACSTDAAILAFQHAAQVILSCCKLANWA